MLKTAVDVATPCLVFLLMLVVGLELTAEDFRRGARRLRLVALATLGPVVLWPLAAVALLATLPLKPHVGTGLLPVAVFATAYVLSQVPILVAAVVLFRLFRAPIPETTA
jgi:predicted Na+-dependent transporter